MKRVFLLVVRIQNVWLPPIKDTCNRRRQDVAFISHSRYSLFCNGKLFAIRLVARINLKKDEYSIYNLFPVLIVHFKVNVEVSLKQNIGVYLIILNNIDNNVLLNKR